MDRRAASANSWVCNLLSPTYSLSNALVLCHTDKGEGRAYPSDCSGGLLVEKADSVTLGAWLGRGGGSSSARSMVGQASCCTALSSGMCMGALWGRPAVQIQGLEEVDCRRCICCEPHGWCKPSCRG